MNYGANSFLPLKVQQQKTVINELPFYGETTYNQNFINFSGKNCKIDISLPVIPNPLFLYFNYVRVKIFFFFFNRKNNSSQIGISTTNQREFRQYPISNENSIFKSNDEVIKIKFYNYSFNFRNLFSKNIMEKLTFPGQYKSTTSRDFFLMKKTECPFAKINK